MREGLLYIQDFHEYKPSRSGYMTPSAGQPEILLVSHWRNHETLQTPALPDFQMPIDEIRIRKMVNELQAVPGGRPASGRHEQDHSLHRSNILATPFQNWMVPETALWVDSLRPAYTVRDTIALCVKEGSEREQDGSYSLISLHRRKAVLASRFCSVRVNTSTTSDVSRSWCKSDSFSTNGN